MKTLYDISKENNLKPEELQIVLQASIKNMSLWTFLFTILGFKDMNHIHKDLCEFLTATIKSKLVLMPRYSFKSTICTIGLALYKLVKNPNTRVLIYSDASSKAQGFLNSAKAHIEGKTKGSSLSTVFDWYSDYKWNESQIVIKDRTTSYPEPSIDTGGIETSKVGMHYDVIIFDDIVSDKNITTKDQMDKVTECYKKALSLLKPGGEVYMIGTRWHFGDLYGRLVAEKNDFAKFIIDGEKDSKYGDYPFADIGLTKEFLDKQKSTQGSYIYSCLYRNNPVDPDTAVFRTTDFKFYGSVKPDDLYITCTCDPAGEGADFTGITVVGTDHNMDMYLLDAANEHLQPSEIVDTIMRLNRKYRFKILGLEMNFFRGMLKIEIQRRIDQERMDDVHFNLFGIHEFEASSKAGGSKYNRIMALQPYHERGSLKFPGEKLELLQGVFSTLAYQMIEFPNSQHDDLLDSLAYHLPLIRKGGVVKKDNIPLYSPAWLEQKSFNDELEIQKHIPRRFRKQLWEPSFA